MVQSAGLMARFEGEKQPTIVATHGFKKKKNKTPQSEIDKAERQKRDY
jgi:phage-related protein